MSGGCAVTLKIHYISFPVARPQQVVAGKSLLCLLCRVVSHVPLQRLVANLLAVSLTSPQQVGNFPVYGESYGETCVMDFERYSTTTRHYRRLYLWL